MNIYQKILFLIVILTVLIIPFDWNASATDSQRFRDKEVSVTFITFDGIRHEDFQNELKEDGKLKNFHQWQETQGLLIGDDELFIIGNPSAISMPGYQSIFAGFPTLCFSNECGRIRHKTFLERLKIDLDLETFEIASISSWELLPLAAEQNQGTVFTNAGRKLTTPIEGYDDIVERQNVDVPPWARARWDVYTHEFATRYFQKHSPRFLHVGYNDLDEWGHKGNRESYLETLERYDQYFLEWAQRTQNASTPSCLFVTTDHGRGSGEKWTRHSNGEPTAALAFLYGFCNDRATHRPLVMPVFTSHLSIRPTIEALFGLRPQNCVTCSGKLPFWN